MREAIGGTWLFGLVITFIVFFASFLAISINYAKAFNVKNNIVDLIGKYEGNNKGARDKIGKYLTTAGYLVTGKCPTTDVDGYKYIGFDKNGDRVNSGKKALYCISCDSIENKIEEDKSEIDKKFYRVMIFFKVDLPVVGNLTTFKIKGETESIYFPTDDVATCD